jgi:hypothetical protein
MLIGLTCDGEFAGAVEGVDMEKNLKGVKIDEVSGRVDVRGCLKNRRGSRPFQSRFQSHRHDKFYPSLQELQMRGI